MKLDRRTKEWARWKEIVDGLTAHVGGSPSMTLRETIESLALDMLRLDMLRQKAIDGGLTDHDRRELSMLRTHERLGMRELGIRPVPASRPSLEQHLADVAARGREPTAA